MFTRYIELVNNCKMLDFFWNNLIGLSKLTMNMEKYKKMLRNAKGTL